MTGPVASSAARCEALAMPPLAGSAAKRMRGSPLQLETTRAAVSSGDPSSTMQSSQCSYACACTERIAAPRKRLLDLYVGMTMLTRGRSIQFRDISRMRRSRAGLGSLRRQKAFQRWSAGASFCPRVIRGRRSRGWAPLAVATRNCIACSRLVAGGAARCAAAAKMRANRYDPLPSRLTSVLSRPAARSSETSRLAYASCRSFSSRRTASTR